MQNMSEPKIRIKRNAGDGALKVPQKTCGICSDASGKYTCPRCNISFCSLECFKHDKHSGCSESFYKDCFVEEMKQSRASDDEKLRIMKMLKNFEDECDADNILDNSSLEERLEEVNLDDSEAVWSRLTVEERNEFERNIQDGSLVKEWSPWWLYHDTSVVIEMESEQSDIKEKLTVPQHDVKTPSLDNLLNGNTPSPLVRNNLVNVLYCYAYFCRRYNGNVKDFSCEIAHDTISTSTFLGKSITSLLCVEAIQAAMDACVKLENDLNIANRMRIEGILDTYHLLLGPRKDTPDVYAHASISELHAMSKTLKGCIKRREFSSSFGTKDIFKTMKKMKFLLSWTNDYKTELLPLALEVYAVYRDKLKFIEEHETIKQSVEAVRKVQQSRQRPIIEEIT